MKTKRILAPRILALSTLLANSVPVRADSMSFQPGEILVNELVSGSVQRYSASGSLLQTFTGSNVEWKGASLTPDGNLATAYAESSDVVGIHIFSPSGTQIMSFATPGNGFPGDVSVFANGTLALNDQVNGTLQLWSQTGTLLQTVNLPGVSYVFGSTVGSDGILYVAGASSSNIARVDSSGTLLGLISLNFNPGDLVMNPLDGTLWVSGYDNDSVEHIATDGTLLGSFRARLSSYFTGIGLAPDDNSLYVTSEFSQVVKHFDLNGNLLDSFALANPNVPWFLTVVPSPAPEPASATLLFCGFALLVTRRHRSA